MFLLVHNFALTLHGTRQQNQKPSERAQCKGPLRSPPTPILCVAIMRGAFEVCVLAALCALLAGAHARVLGGGMPWATSNTLMAVGLFSSSSCASDTLSGLPLVASSGACVYSDAFDMYYTSSFSDLYSSIVESKYFCDASCTSPCVKEVAATPSTCSPLSPNNTYVQVWPLLRDDVHVQVFEDSECAPSSRLYEKMASANLCTSAEGLGGYYAAVATSTGELLFAYNCNSTCDQTCDSFAIMTKRDSCFPLTNGKYLKLQKAGGGSVASHAQLSLLVLVATALAGYMIY